MVALPLWPEYMHTPQRMATGDRRGEIATTRVYLNWSDMSPSAVWPAGAALRSCLCQVGAACRGHFGCVAQRCWFVRTAAGLDRLAGRLRSVGGVAAAAPAISG